MGIWQKTTESHKLGFPMACTRGRRDRKICQRIEQNELKGVLGQMTTDSEQRILDSANSREGIVLQKAVSVTVKMREDTASATRKYKFLRRLRGPVCRRIYMRKYAYSPRKVST